MPLVTTSRYSAVASTLALALAAGGTGYAASSVAHARSAHHKKPNTSPTLVINVAANGKVHGDLHRLPVSGNTKIKHASTGFYVFKTPGLRVGASTTATCSVANYLPATATVDRVDHSFAVHVFGAARNPADIAFQCSVWAHLPK